MKGLIFLDFDFEKKNMSSEMTENNLNHSLKYFLKELRSFQKICPRYSYCAIRAMNIKYNETMRW